MLPSRRAAGKPPDGCGPGPAEPCARRAQPDNMRHERRLHSPGGPVKRSLAMVLWLCRKAIPKTFGLAAATRRGASDGPAQSNQHRQTSLAVPPARQEYYLVLKQTAHDHFSVLGEIGGEVGQEPSAHRGGGVHPARPNDLAAGDMYGGRLIQRDLPDVDGIQA